MANNVRPNNVRPNNVRPNNVRPNTVNPNTAPTYASNAYTANAYTANAYAAAPSATVQPNYVMKKSAWSVVRPWHILLFFLIVPLIIMIVKIINIKDESISFYNNKVVQRSGIFSKYEKTNILTRVLSVTVKQTFWGRIFNYGNIYVDVVGRWDVKMIGIKNPKEAKAYLEKIAIDGMRMRPVIMN